MAPRYYSSPALALVSLQGGGSWLHSVFIPRGQRQDGMVRSSMGDEIGKQIGANANVSRRQLKLMMAWASFSPA